ncbi:cysteine hydrolase [Catellatospora tritici]|uniref:cysteine hydrolase n=1 Tax=Catellatospora tritici TaxID=2851566 RepID=UPI001C2CEE1C|nr:cysteine hydrolase [Catellatospora tritici]MBV1851232.1 cysteine hydrolase [Catellatospora tritici]
MSDDETATHAWHIEPREYARQEQRRGRRHAYERLDPARTALVVVDMVPFFVAESRYCRGIVANIETLAHALRAAGGTVAWVVPTSTAPTAWARDFYGDEVARSFAASGGTGSPRERLWPAFTVDSTDLTVEKSLPSAFHPDSSALPELLAERGVDTVLVTGTVTNVCCEATARDAAARQLRVVMVADANAARRDADHNATLHTVYRSFGDVRPTAEVLDLIRSGSPGAR